MEKLYYDNEDMQKRLEAITNDAVHNRSISLDAEYISPEFIQFLFDNDMIPPSVHNEQKPEKDKDFLICMLSGKIESPSIKQKKKAWCILNYEIAPKLRVNAATMEIIVPRPFMATAITTIYHGYKFRSREEARWAVFFDAAGIKYLYEPEGMELPDGTRYLPDFYLPDEDIYIEVKPGAENRMDEIQKAKRFVGCGINVLLVLPSIPNPQAGESAVFWYSAFYHSPLMRCVVKTYISIVQDTYLMSDSVKVAFLRQSTNDINPEDDEASGKIDTLSDEAFTGEYDHPLRAVFDGGLIRRCYEIARQARFEFGETPKVEKLSDEYSGIMLAEGSADETIDDKFKEYYNKSKLKDKIAKAILQILSINEEEGDDDA